MKASSNIRILRRKIFTMMTPVEIWKQNRSASDECQLYHKKKRSENNVLTLECRIQSTTHFHLLPKRQNLGRSTQSLVDLVASFPEGLSWDHSFSVRHMPKSEPSSTRPERPENCVATFSFSFSLFLQEYKLLLISVSVYPIKEQPK